MALHKGFAPLLLVPKTNVISVSPMEFVISVINHNEKDIINFNNSIIFLTSNN